MRGGSVAEKSTVCRSLGVSARIASMILGESHVEHLVGLVENHDGNPVQLQLLAADQVESPARRGDDDVDPALQRSQLRSVRLPAVDRQHAGARLLGRSGERPRQPASPARAWEPESVRTACRRSAALAASRCRSGRAKAAVLPVPVAA